MDYIKFLGTSYQSVLQILVTNVMKDLDPRYVTHVGHEPWLHEKQSLSCRSLAGAVYTCILYILHVLNTCFSLVGTGQRLLLEPWTWLHTFPGQKLLHRVLGAAWPEVRIKYRSTTTLNSSFALGL